MLDLSDLQDRVIESWNNEGIEWGCTDTQYNDQFYFTETFIKPEFDEILNDPWEMINILGYNSFSEYMREERNA